MKIWRDEIDNITENFVECFGAFSFEQLNWKPNTKTWSIAQNIDHLIVINESYFSIINLIREGTYKTPLIGSFRFIVSVFGKIILKGVKPDRKNKIKTFPIWEPTKSEISLEIIDRFKKHQSELKSMIADSNDLVKKGKVISSPANKNIVYKLEKAFEIIVTHEKRHFEQSKEIYQLIKEKSSS
jgi:hypothetical protein